PYAYTSDRIQCTRVCTGEPAGSSRRIVSPNAYTSGRIQGIITEQEAYHLPPHLTARSTSPTSTAGQGRKGVGCALARYPRVRIGIRSGPRDDGSVTPTGEQSLQK